MRVLITGANGQLGQALQRYAPTALSGEPLQWRAVGRRDLDLTDPEACHRYVADFQPDWLINAAAYTAVDQAELEPELAQAVNAEAPRAFAKALAGGGGRMLQLSTDFVFNGSQGAPYQPTAPVEPLGVYGASKAAGEKAVLARLGDTARAHVLRTAWVYGPVGGNFLLTMLRLHREREQIQVVADQVGCPTSTAGLAAACWRVLDPCLADSGLPAILHWSDAGVASWYDFAVAIGELAQSAGVLDTAAEVIPIQSHDYPTPARRPSYSLLDCTASRSALDLGPQHWRVALRRVIEELHGMETTRCGAKAAAKH